MVHDNVLILSRRLSCIAVFSASTNQQPSEERLTEEAEGGRNFEQKVMRRESFEESADKLFIHRDPESDNRPLRSSILNLH